MGEEQKRDLRSKGYVVTEKIHVWVITITTLLVFIGGLVAMYATAYSEKEQIKKNVSDHQEELSGVKNRIESVEDNLRIIKENQIEVNINLKNFMESKGFHYQSRQLTKELK